jgi:hypothetical protein
MWNWYNRPGGRESLPWRAVAAAMVVAGLLVGVVFALLYGLLAPVLFTRVPG